MSLDAGIRDRILRGQPPDAAGLGELVQGEAARLGRAGVDQVRSELAADLLGAGPLEPLLADPEVTDILVNGDGSVWVDRGRGLEQVAVTGLGPESARRLAVRLAGQAGRRLDESQPWVDGLLPGGVRLHAVLPPLVDGGAHLSLRVPRSAGPRLTDLQATGMFDAETGLLLRRLVERRVSLVVTGGTGTRQDDAARRPAGRGAGRRAHRAGGGRPRARGGPSPRRAAPGPGRQRRGTRRGHPGRPRPPGPADAAGPAGRGRGPRSGGARAVGRPQHRPRGRLRHGPRQQPRGRRGALRGARRPGRSLACGGPRPARQCRAGGGARAANTAGPHRRVGVGAAPS